MKRLGKINGEFAKQATQMNMDSFLRRATAVAAVGIVVVVVIG